MITALGPFYLWIFAGLVISVPAFMLWLDNRDAKLKKLAAAKEAASKRPAKRRLRN